MKPLDSYPNLAVIALILSSVPAFAAQIAAPGVPNFHQVDEQVYRGGQPTEEGWRSLAKLGVKTVLDLRREGESGEHSIAAEAEAVRAAGMRYVNIAMQGAPSAPSDEQIAKALSLLGSGEPVFVHCKEGKDRTGTVIACYRIAHDRWNNRKALDEAKIHGIHWYEMGMKRYIQNFEPASVRVAADLQTAAAQP